MSSEIRSRLQQFINGEKSLLSQLLRLQKQRKYVGSDIGKAILSEGIGVFAEELFESSRAGRFGRRLGKSLIDQEQNRQLLMQEKNIENEHIALLQSVKSYLQTVSSAKSKLQKPNSSKLLGRLEKAQGFAKVTTRIRHTIKMLDDISNSPLICNKEISIQPAMSETIIHPGKPFSASLKLREILKSAKGYVKVIDPYVDGTTLETLLSIPTGVPIKLLTVYTGGKEKERRFVRTCQRFKAERPLFEIKKCDPESVHDRFVLTQARCWSFGVSLKDVGRKLSLIKEVSPETKREVDSIFKQLWDRSSNLPA